MYIIYKELGPRKNSKQKRENFAEPKESFQIVYFSFEMILRARHRHAMKIKLVTVTKMMVMVEAVRALVVSCFYSYFLSLIMMITINIFVALV